MISTEEKPQEVLQLYEQLCRFNYHRDLDPHRRPLQANPELDELQRTNSQQITAVPLHFSTAEAYVQFWRPLFFEEVKSYVSSCRSTEATKP